jgi:hypothetical protein
VLAVLALLVTLQRPTPQTPPASPARPSAQPARPGAPAVAAPASGPGTPYDSTAAAIVTIGYRVGYVRGALSQLRLIASNQPGNLASGADRMRQRCRDLERSAPEEGRRLCRSCLPAPAQAAVERYRRRIEPLRALGAECARTLEPLAAGRERLTADRRRTVAALSGRVTAALRLYEADLQRVRVAFGWTSSRVAEPTRP